MHMSVYVFQCLLHRLGIPAALVLTAECMLHARCLITGRFPSLFASTCLGLSCVCFGGIAALNNSIVTLHVFVACLCYGCRHCFNAAAGKDDDHHRYEANNEEDGFDVHNNDNC